MSLRHCLPYGLGIIHFRVVEEMSLESAVWVETLVLPYTLHPTPYILHPTPNTQHPTPSALHPTPQTQNP